MFSIFRSVVVRASLQLLVESDGSSRQFYQCWFRFASSRQWSACWDWEDGVVWSTRPELHVKEDGHGCWDPGCWMHDAIVHCWILSCVLFWRLTHQPQRQACSAFPAGRCCARLSLQWPAACRLPASAKNHLALPPARQAVGNHWSASFIFTDVFFSVSFETLLGSKEIWEQEANRTHSCRKIGQMTKSQLSSVVSSCSWAQVHDSHPLGVLVKYFVLLGL